MIHAATSVSSAPAAIANDNDVRARRDAPRDTRHSARAVIHSSALAVACYFTYSLITHVLSQVGIAVGVAAGWAGPGFTVPSQR